MQLRFLGTDSGSDTCPTMYATDRGTLVVQGWRVTDPDALAQLAERGLPATETAVEIPRQLLRFAETDEG